MNFTYKAPPGLEAVCGDLPCFKGPGQAISCWYFPSWKDRLRFLFTGRMWFWALTDSHPPISLLVKSPFEPVKEAQVTKAQEQ